MKKIAIITSGLTGIVNISIAIANRLKKEGFEIVYLCPIDVQKKVSSVVPNFIKLPLLPLENYNNSSENSDILETYATYKNELKAVQADCFLIDVELHELIFTAYGLSIPIRLISPWFTGEKGEGYPPLTSAILPTPKMAVSMAWYKRELKTFLKKILKPNHSEISRRNALKNLAQKNGFPLNTLKNSAFPPIFLNRHLNTYCCNLESLDFPNNKLPSNYKYIGPQVSDFRQTLDSDNEDMKNIERIIKRAKEEGKKIIYCSLSSFQKGDTHFLENIIKTCGSENKWVLIASLGGLITPDSFNSIPENVHLFSWVAQLYILSKADLSINHGGINTINECILNEVPMLVYSGQNYDQNGCMARVYYHNLGLQGNKEEDGVETIKQKINTILENSSFKEQTIQMSKAIKALKNQSITTLLDLKK